MEEIGEKDGGKKSIIFVCYGNSCRSPIAEALFHKKCPPGEYLESSRGLHATDGAGPTEHGVTVMASTRYGLDIRGHKRKRFSSLDATEASVIVPLDSMINESLARNPEASSKLLFLQSIEDPYGGDLAAYEQCAFEIDEMIDKVLLYLFPVAKEP